MKEKTINKISVLIIIISILTLSLTLFNPIPTGKVTTEQYQEYTEQINKNFYQDTTFTWTPKNEGRITSIKISGETKKDSNSKIFFETLLIFNNRKTKFGITGNPILESENITNQTETNETIDNVTIEEDNQTIDNVTNQTETNETIDNVTIEEDNQTIDNVTNQTETNETIDNVTIEEDNQTIENTTQEETEEEIPEETIEENITENITQEKIISQTVSFENICEETCSLKNKIEKENYTIKIDTDSEVKLTKISYTIDKSPVETQEENSTTKEQIKKDSKIETDEPDKTKLVKIIILSLAIIGIIFSLFRNNPKKKAQKKK